jgi:4-hydroxybenzoate polyprenyltransferase
MGNCQIKSELLHLITLLHLIAFMRTKVILFMFIGFGILSLLEFGLSGNVSNCIEAVIKFLVACLTLFSLYAINKFADLFSSLSAKK